MEEVIYVDFPQSCVMSRRWRWPVVSHLSCAPSADLTALHEFAARLGLRRCWFQPRGGIMPHYDLSPAKYRVALVAGAVELKTREDVVRLIRGWRQFQSTRPSQLEF